MTTCAPPEAPPISAEWLELFKLIPGYDPVATAGDAWFDAEAAQFAIDFIQECIHHVEGDEGQLDEDGRPGLFILQPWQKAITGCIFGWKRIDAKGRTVRRYREVLLYIARKNGKTPWGAAVALLVFLTDPERGQQNYIAADSREQAGKLFRQLKGMVTAEPELDRRCRVFGGTAQAGQAKSVVKRGEETSFIQVISADAQTQHGGTTHLAIVDELHTQPNGDLVGVLTSSMVSLNRPQPLMIFLTTADFDRPSVCNSTYDYACKVRDGILEDPSFLPVIFEARPEDDWRLEETWRKANPNLGVSVSAEDLRRACTKAQAVVSLENDFRRLHCNQRTGQSERVIPMEQWKACGKEPVDRAKLVGQECHGGLDIGAMSDFTAFILDFPHQDPEQVQVPVDPENPDRELMRTITRRSHTWLCWLWLPSHPVRRDPRMEAVIAGWIKQGHVRVTPGNIVDYELVLADIIKIVDPYHLNDIALDRGFQGNQMGINLTRHFGERKIFWFPQGILSMNPPFRELLELLATGRLHHENNPALYWMASNVVAERKGGLIKPSKDKSTEKIDGITAGTMALGRAITTDVGAGWETVRNLRN